MTINLKQIRSLDTDNIKLDKINYNFDQLIVNGGGPKGYIGPDGNTGPQGFQGVLGVQGNIGVQGVQGSNAPSTTTYWEAVPQDLEGLSNVMATLFSKHPISSPTPTYASIIASGYITGDTGYSQQQSSTSGLPKYQWVINRRSNKVASNLRFTSDGIIDGNSFDITMDNSGGLYKLYMGFINNQNSQLNLQAQEHIIRNSAGTGDGLFSISTTSGITHDDTFFEASVAFNKKLSIENADAGTDKILTSDNIGAVTFKTTEELGGSVKIGTILSILPSIFGNGQNFIDVQTISTGSNPNVPIQIRIGAGIGDYAGWYVCNGQEWEDGNTLSFIVPDTNSYSFQIVSNPITSDPNSQGNILVNNNEVQILGGADTTVVADQVGTVSAQYNVSSSTYSGNVSIDSNPSGTGFKIKKLPQIIYLGATNLYWSQLGTGQSIPADFNGSDFNIGDFNAS